jgi:hypothetical protein
MTLSPPVRKLTLTAHVIASVGWVGALAVFLAHAIASVSSEDEQIIRAAALAMGLSAWFVILPLSLASLTTGLVQALGTAWGLFRHYWVLFKLLLTAVATTVLLMKLGPIGYLADMAKEASFSGANLIGLRTSLAIHAVGGMVVLLAAVTLAIFKPAGTVRSASAPRWVKIFGAFLAILLLMVGMLLLAGEHGPGAHLPGSSS